MPTIKQNHVWNVKFFVVKLLFMRIWMNVGVFCMLVTVLKPLSVTMVIVFREEMRNGKSTSSLKLIIENVSPGYSKSNVWMN